MDNLQYIVTFSGVVISAIVSLIINRASKKQRDSDASGKITDAAVKLVEPLQRQIDDLEEEISALRKSVGTLRKGVRILTGQIKDAGLTPLWQPEDEEL